MIRTIKLTDRFRLFLSFREAKLPPALQLHGSWLNFTRSVLYFEAERIDVPEL